MFSPFNFPGHSLRFSYDLEPDPAQSPWWLLCPRALATGLPPDLLFPFYPLTCGLWSHPSLPHLHLHTSLPPAHILTWLYTCPFRGTQVIPRWTARAATSSADVKLESLSFSPDWFFHRSLGDILNSFLLLTSPTIQLVPALGWFHLILCYCLESFFHSHELSSNLLVPGTALSTVHACPHWIIWTIS